jgi:hypothetical protein
LDISDTLAPKSDQLDYEDLLAGPRTFTITGVRKGTAEQPVQIDLAEFDRPWRPGKSMRRLLVAVWGADASQYIGRQVTLYGDPTVRFGGIAVGGTRISHVSHIDKPTAVMLMVSRGKRQEYVLKPITGAPDAPAESVISDDVAGDWVATIQAAEDMTELQNVWGDARKQGVARDPRVLAAKDARKTQLTDDELREMGTDQ